MNNKENTNLHCDIVNDLLPLYKDGAVSEKTSEEVKKHLNYCKKCKGEYDRISTEIIPPFLSTVNQFSKTMKKRKLKQILVTCLCCIITIVFATGGYYLLTEAHLKTLDNVLDDLEIECVYRYNNGNEDKFFVSYFTNNMSGSSATLKKKEIDGKTAYVFERKIPILSKNGADRYHEIESFSVGDDCETLWFGETEIWTKENNADDTIPGYVYAYEEFENGNGEENDEATSFGYDDDNQHFIIIYSPSNRIIKWDIDGNVVFDSEKAEVAK